MTELEVLRQRRELVMLAAEMQRANVVRRVQRLKASPARHVFGFAARAASRPAMLTLGTAAVKLAVRLWRRRSARTKLKHH